MSEKEQLMKQLSEQQFATHEVALFLDTHPYDVKALEAWDKFAKRYRELKAEYEKKYGMLDIYSPNNSTEKWTWIDSPWPWEGRMM